MAPTTCRFYSGSSASLHRKNACRRSPIPAGPLHAFLRRERRRYQLDVDEACQEAFPRIARVADRYDGRPSFAWFCLIIHNVRSIQRVIASGVSGLPGRPRTTPAGRLTRPTRGF